MRRRRRKGLAGTTLYGIGNLTAPTGYEKGTLNPDEPVFFVTNRDQVRLIVYGASATMALPAQSALARPDLTANHTEGRFVQNTTRKNEM